MVNIINRSAWDARAPRAVTRTTWSARTGFTVHYSAGPRSQTVRQIQDFHMDGRGWSDVGYNFVVKDGKVYEGRGWLVVGAHAAPHNTSHIGVCVIGRDGDATDADKRAVRALYEEANRRAGRTLAKTWHGGLSGNSTSCPGADLRAWVRAGMPAPGGGGGSSAPEPPSTGKAPTYPLASTHWFGPESPNPRNHSGYWSADRPHIRRIRDRMRDRGWFGVATGDRYDQALADQVRKFQAEKNLAADGLVGPATWRALWEAPIT